VGAAVTQPEPFVEGRRESSARRSNCPRRPTRHGVGGVRRAASSSPGSSEPAPTHHASKLDVDATLRRWNIAIVQGSRWVGCRSTPRLFGWSLRCVRGRPRRRPTAGSAAAGNGSRSSSPGSASGCSTARADARPGAAARSDPLHDITTLPGIIAHELSNPLTAARAGLHLAMESLGRLTEVVSDHGRARTSSARSVAAIDLRSSAQRSSRGAGRRARPSRDSNSSCAMIPGSGGDVVQRIGTGQPAPGRRRLAPSSSRGRARRARA